MKRIAFISIVCLLCVVGIAFSAPKDSALPPTAWSQEVNGLEGRLLVKFKNLKNGPREVMTLELRNVSRIPIFLTNQPQFTARLFDDNGHEIPQPGRAVSILIPPPQNAVIPEKAYLGFRVDTPVMSGVKKSVFLAFGISENNMWHLKPGKYTLQSTMVIPKNKDNKNQWTGKMKLPPVSFVVTDEQAGG